MKLKFINNQPLTLRLPSAQAHNHQLNSGQVVLMLVLITIVGLTIGLSLISRTVTDNRISSQIEQSGRAFSAAEAGAEVALKTTTIGSTGSITLGDSSGSYNIAQLGGTADTINLPLTFAGDSQTVWFIDHKDDVTLDMSAVSFSPNESFYICWGNNPGDKPAIAISFYYFDSLKYKTVFRAYDYHAIDHSNNFNGIGVVDSGGSNYCGGSYQFRTKIIPTGIGIPANAKLLLMRILPLYASTNISVSPSAKLPVQGKIITSVGTTQTNTVRKIQVIQSYSILPEIFDYGFFIENYQD